MANRREPQQTDSVVLQQDTEQGIAVNKDGTPCTSGVPFGVTMDKADSGMRTVVARQGFVPVTIAVASGFSEGDRVAPTTGGQVGSTGTAPAAYFAVLEEDASADGSLVDAWVNTLDNLLT